MRRFSVQHLPAFVPEGDHPYRSPLVYPRVFSERQCDRIVADASDLTTESGQVGSDGDDAVHDDEIRRSRLAWVPADERFRWIHDKLATVVRRANAIYGFDLVGFTEELQFTEYEGAGAFYTWHQDGLHGELAVRKLSLVVQLSHPGDYVGGDLEVFGEAEVGDERRGRGTVVAFPAFEYHRVTPLVSGTRRSLVCWIGGPPFR